MYDPCRPNDRLLLGMKGSISEFELNVIRSRMPDAKHGKALRGGLRISVPIGSEARGCANGYPEGDLIHIAMLSLTAKALLEVASASLQVRLDVRCAQSD